MTEIEEQRLVQFFGQQIGSGDFFSLFRDSNGMLMVEVRHGTLRTTFPLSE